MSDMVQLALRLWSLDARFLSLASGFESSAEIVVQQPLDAQPQQAGVEDVAHAVAAADAEPDSAAPSEVLAARRIVEAETAALAAAHATRAQIDRMRDANDTMAATIDDIAAFDAADARFHALIADAAGNDVLSGFIAQLWRMRESAMWAFWYDQTRHPDNRHRSVEDHRMILRAVERRLPDAARTAMQAHLDVLANRFYDLKL